MPTNLPTDRTLQNTDPQHVADHNALAGESNRIKVGVGVLASRPPFGNVDHMYFATNVRGGTLYRDSGAAWVRVSGARGELDNGYAEITTTVAGVTSTSGVDVAGLTITPDCDGGPIWVEAAFGTILMSAGTVPKWGGLFIMENGVIVGATWGDVTRLSGYNGSIVSRCRRTPPAGATTTYKVQAIVEAGTWSYVATINYPAYIVATGV